MCLQLRSRASIVELVVEPHVDRGDTVGGLRHRSRSFTGHGPRGVGQQTTRGSASAHDEPSALGARGTGCGPHVELLLASEHVRLRVGAAENPFVGVEIGEPSGGGDGDRLSGQRGRAGPGGGGRRCGGGDKGGVGCRGADRRVPWLGGHHTGCDETDDHDAGDGREPPGSSLVVGFVEHRIVGGQADEVVEVRGTERDGVGREELDVVRSGVVSVGAMACHGATTFAPSASTQLQLKEPNSLYTCAA